MLALGFFIVIAAAAITVELVGKILIRDAGITAYQHFAAFMKKKKKKKKPRKQTKKRVVFKVYKFFPN